MVSGSQGEGKMDEFKEELFELLKKYELVINREDGYYDIVYSFAKRNCPKLKIYISDLRDEYRMGV